MRGGHGSRFERVPICDKCDSFALQCPCHGGEFRELHCKLGAAVPRRHSQFAADPGGESGAWHYKPGHAVQIELGLRPQSPENGSFSIVCRRLSAIPLAECPKWEPRDWRLIRKSPPLVGLSASIRGIFSERRTAWLGREDSNLRMVESKSGRTFNKINAHSE
jgi:hypothetical protein